MNDKPESLVETHGTLPFDALGQAVKHKREEYRAAVIARRAAEVAEAVAYTTMRTLEGIAHKRGFRYLIELDLALPYVVDKEALYFIVLTPEAVPWALEVAKKLREYFGEHRHIRFESSDDELWVYICVADLDVPEARAIMGKFNEEWYLDRMKNDLRVHATMGWWDGTVEEHDT